MMIKKRFARLMSTLICSLSIASSLHGHVQQAAWAQPLQLVAEAPKHLASLLQASTIDIESQKPLTVEAPVVIDPTDGKPRKISWNEWLANIGPNIKDHLCDQGSLYGAFMFLGVGLLCISEPAAVYDNLSTPATLLNTIKQIPYASILQAFALQYARYFAINAAHEGGHALANYLINGTIADVYLGTFQAADGVEILPHLIISGIHPSGATEGIKNPLLKTYQDRLKAIVDVYKKFKALYPHMTQEERAACKEMQAAIAAANALDKNFINRLKFTAIATAGAISALVANGAIKFIAGEPILALDHYDIKQLQNLMPAPGFDGGKIMSTVFDRPDITQAGNNWYISAALMAYFLKACTENGCIENIASASFQETAKKLLQACGFASLNFAGMGLAHASAGSMVPAAA